MSYISATQAKQIAQKAVDNLKDGTLVPKLAENLTPYAEDSGTTQTQPFFLEGTATGNSESRVDAKQVPAYAFLQEKRGNMVCVNQMLNSADFPATTTVNGITFTNNADGTITVNGTATANASISLTIITSVSGHAYFMSGCPAGGSDSTYSFDFGGGYKEFGQGQIITPSAVTRVVGIQVYSGTTVSNLVFRPKLVDLTQWFDGNIPAYLLSHPEAFGRYYKGPLTYEPGRLEPATGRYLTSVGRNIWDEEWEQGNVLTDGTLGPTTNAIRSKNFIEVSSSETYYLYLGNNARAHVLFYDSNQTFFARNAAGYVRSGTFTTPAGCHFIKFSTYPSDNISVYKNDITISLYYSGESGYDKYYPHEVLATIDTGTEGLGAFDYKVPSGLITRATGSVDLGTLDWVWSGDGNAYTDDLMTVVSENNISMLGEGFVHIDRTDTSGYWGGTIDKCYYFATNKRLYLRNKGSTAATFASLLSGIMLYYELATPTTEQGTPFQETVPIDDFGQLSWSNTDVPQGNQIFYPVDYKAYEDTLIKYTDGDATSIALVEDVEGEETARGAADMILQNAIGGTLRQCLCVKESLDFDNTDFMDLGTLTWTRDTSGTYPIFKSNISGIVVPSEANEMNIICTKYAAYGSIAESPFKNNEYNKVVRQTTLSTQIMIQDSTYTDATTFKNAMKGVLLAYEKA